MSPAADRHAACGTRNYMLRFSMYRAEFSKPAIRALRAMPRQIADRVVRKIEQLALNPYSASNVKKLQGRDGYRLRIGDIRVLFDLKEAELIVFVIDIMPRGSAYKD